MSRLSDLILLGPGRNVAEFNAQVDAQSPAKVSATTIDAKNIAVSQQTAAPADLDPVGKQPEVGLVKEDDVAVHIAPPRHGDTVDLAQYVKSLAEKLNGGNPPRRLDLPVRKIVKADLDKPEVRALISPEWLKK